MAGITTDTRKFLGSGVVFPLGLDAQGRIAMNSLEDHVRQSILLILQTAKGERVMRSDFGAGLQALVFSPMTAATATLVQHEVTDALVRFEPRIDVLDVKVTVDPREQGPSLLVHLPGREVPVDPSQQSLLLIDLKYRVRSTDAIFNMVYPFFLEKGVL